MKAYCVVLRELTKALGDLERVNLSCDNDGQVAYLRFYVWPAGLTATYAGCVRFHPYKPSGKGSLSHGARRIAADAAARAKRDEDATIHDLGTVGFTTPVAEPDGATGAHPPARQCLCLEELLQFKPETRDAAVGPGSSERQHEYEVAEHEPEKSTTTT